MFFLILHYGSQDVIRMQHIEDFLGRLIQLRVMTRVTRHCFLLINLATGKS